MSATKNGGPGELVDQFELEILEYLRRRPYAADDLPGVAYWWLYHQRYLRNLALLETALDGLVSKGFVARSDGSSGSVIYSAGPKFKPDHRTEAPDAS